MYLAINQSGLIFDFKKLIHILTEQFFLRQMILRPIGGNYHNSREATCTVLKVKRSNPFSIPKADINPSACLRCRQWSKNTKTLPVVKIGFN